jgi:hypothetical protein
MMHKEKKMENARGRTGIKKRRAPNTNQVYEVLF